MEPSVDRRLLKVLGLCLATFAGVVLFLAESGAVDFAAVFGEGPVGAALAAVTVLVGLAAWVAFEVNTEEAFAD